LNSSALRRQTALLALVLIGGFPAGPSCAAAEIVTHSEVLDLDEAAALLRVGPELVRELAETHRIPARRVGDVWRLSRSALLEWLKDGQGASASRTPPATPTTPGNPLPLPSEPLAGEHAALTARGGAPQSSPRVAQVATEARPQPSAAPPTVGERPSTPTADEIALRDQRVLKRGAAAVDFGLSYSRSEQTLFPVIRQEQRTLGANAAVRYGLLDELQLKVQMPSAWRRTTTFTDGAINAAAASRVTRDNFFGDASLSLLGVALREGQGRPNVIWSIDGVVPTGPGDRGLGGGLVLSKSYDPAVIFAGLSYLRGFSVDLSDPQRSLARHNLGLSFGYTYAVNDALALSTVFVGTYRNLQSPDGISIPPPRERHQLQLGMTWMLAHGLFMEPSVAMRLGSASPDLTVSVNMSHSF
jgi:excisionase family DNA binding protein